MFVAVLAGLAVLVLVRRFGRRVQNIDWEKKMESMPDNAPPKWMFRNLAAIRENTDRILELVEQDHARSAPPAASVS